MSRLIFDKDNWKEIGATLARNKTRTFLTAFGIFWGTTMLALLWGGAQGLLQMLSYNFEGLATNSVIVFPQRTSVPYKGYRKGMSWSLLQTDVDNMRQSVPGIKAVSPIASQYSHTVRYHDKTFSSSIIGVDQDYSEAMSPIITEGRFVNESDERDSRKVAVIGENVARTLFGAASPLGEYVEIDNVFYRVVGVCRQRNEVEINGRLDNNVIIPLSTMRRTYNMGLRVHYIFVIFDDGVKSTDIKPKIERVIRASHPISPDDGQAISFMDISQEYEMVDNVFTGVNILILFVGLSSLLAGVIGVGNIMWIIVKERTREFGIRRAIGAKPRTVLTQILSESAVLTAIAGVAGICFAVGILAVASVAVSQSSGKEVSFQLSFDHAMIIMALFLVLGTAAGTIPALKAMRIKPIEALNDK